jgi:hypothetical protein
MSQSYLIGDSFSKYNQTVCISYLHIGVAVLVVALILTVSGLSIAVSKDADGMSNPGSIRSLITTSDSIIGGSGRLQGFLGGRGAPGYQYNSGNPSPEYVDQVYTGGSSGNTPRMSAYRLNSMTADDVADRSTVSAGVLDMIKKLESDAEMGGYTKVNGRWTKSGFLGHPEYKSGMASTSTSTPGGLTKAYFEGY